MAAIIEAHDSSEANGSGHEVAGPHVACRVGGQSSPVQYQGMVEDVNFFGMYCHEDDLAVSSREDSLTSEVPSQVVLLYNRGQSCVRHRDYMEARKCYQEAFQLLSSKELGQSEQKQHDRRCSFAIKLQHNLGHCCFRMGLLDDALAHYGFVLEDSSAQLTPQRFAAGVSDRAIALNCTAIVHQSHDHFKAVELLSHAIALACSAKEPSCLVRPFMENMLVLCHASGGQQDLPTCPMRSLVRYGYNQEAYSMQSGGTAKAGERPKGNHRVTTSLHALDGALQSVYLSVQEGSLDASDLVQMLELGGDFYFRHTNDYAKSLLFYKDAVSVEQATQCRKHDESLRDTMMKQLRVQVAIHSTSANYPMALANLKQLYDIQCLVHGPNSLQVSETIGSMGWMQFLIGCYSSSLDLYQECLRIRMGSSPTQKRGSAQEQERDIAFIWNMFGLLFIHLKDLDRAGDSFDECLRRLDGPVDDDEANEAIATLMFNHATVELERGREDEAIRFLESSLYHDRKRLGQHHSDLCETLECLGALYQRRGRFEESLHYHQEALNVSKLLLVQVTPESPSAHILGALRKVCHLLNRLGNIFLSTADLPSMMVHLVEATRLVELMRVYGEAQDGVPLIEVRGHLHYIIRRMFPPCAPLA
ncbi:Kinesin light chain [Seminavis robusta]|uniref:Kinesin light chain n=1 Tax=Seminavis robusta TaxID=568900 RepID=A0A9N8EHA3_9STRA|nr:Kinesin light chain [Seminavis robusta]|eukprot:Sro1079_g238850.1 Kinesin light chain (646) ;mRNA; f:3566-5503